MRRTNTLGADKGGGMAGVRVVAQWGGGCEVRAASVGQADVAGVARRVVRRRPGEVVIRPRGPDAEAGWKPAVALYAECAKAMPAGVRLGIEFPSGTRVDRHNIDRGDWTSTWYTTAFPHDELVPAWCDGALATACRWDIGLGSQRQLFALGLTTFFARLQEARSQCSDWLAAGATDPREGEHVRAAYIAIENHLLEFLGLGYRMAPTFFPQAAFATWHTHVRGALVAQPTWVQLINESGLAAVGNPNAAAYARGDGFLNLARLLAVAAASVVEAAGARLEYDSTRVAGKSQQLILDDTLAPEAQADAFLALVDALRTVTTSASGSPRSLVQVGVKSARAGGSVSVRFAAANLEDFVIDVRRKRSVTDAALHAAQRHMWDRGSHATVAWPSRPAGV